MATFDSNTLYKGTVYRAPHQEEELTIEFNVNIGSGVTLTDGDFINLFYLGDGHEIHEMYFRSTDELDTGTAALCAACGWSGSGNEDAIFAATTTQFEQDPVDFTATRSAFVSDEAAVVAKMISIIPSTALTGDSTRLVRLEVTTTANAATDTDVSLYGYAKVRRAAVGVPDETYGWDGEAV